jgi:hypothetical protein
MSVYFTVRAYPEAGKPCGRIELRPRTVKAREARQFLYHLAQHGRQGPDANRKAQLLEVLWQLSARSQSFPAISILIWRQVASYTASQSFDIHDVKSEDNPGTPLPIRLWWLECVDDELSVFAVKVTLSFSLSVIISSRLLS